MDVVSSFLIHNFVLLCLSLVMIFNAVMHYSQNKRISICSIIITACCLVLAVSYQAQMVTKSHGLLYATITCSIIGYVLRPFCIFVFIKMNRKAYTGKWSFLIWLPLVINLIIYLLAYIPNMGNVVFGFFVAQNGELTFTGGPLRYSSHIISFGYMLYLIYLSVFTLKAKHIMHGVTILICAAFVITAVLVETFYADGENIELLNTTIMVSTLTYYLFLYKENISIDTLTGLFNRDTYYRDLPKMQGTVNGTINFDINGLKYLNDNYGHFEGDKAIATIAKTILQAEGKGMYAYRLGGDEFLILANNVTEESLMQTIQKFKENLAKTPYYCSVGYAYSPDNSQSIDDLIRLAEEKMYLEKNEFYKHAEFDRRKV